MFKISSVRSVFVHKTIYGCLKWRNCYLSLLAKNGLNFKYDLPSEITALNVLVSKRHMAGHAKWQNVKHIKAEKDRQKSLMCNKYFRLVRYAAREGGPDPKINIKLANILEEARKYNIGKETLETAMKTSDNKKTFFGTIEILAPGGSMVIVEYETSNVSTTRHDIKVICKKHNANIMSGEGRWRAVYEQKGIITVVKELDSDQLNENKATDSAIEAGAEEVHLKENEAGNNFLEFVCAPDDLHVVKKELEKSYAVEESYVAYIPLSTMQLNEEDMVALDNFLEDMGNLPDVTRLYENVQ